MTSAAPFPSSGRIAPKISADAVRWFRGPFVRAPRSAQRRVILLFSPMRASSANLAHGARFAAQRASRGPFVNRRYSQKPPRPRPVFRTLRVGSEQGRVEIAPIRNRHGELPSFATLNMFAADSGSRRSRPLGIVVERPIAGEMAVRGDFCNIA